MKRISALARTCMLDFQPSLLPGSIQSSLVRKLYDRLQSAVGEALVEECYKTLSDMAGRASDVGKRGWPARGVLVLCHGAPIELS